MPRFTSPPKQLDYNIQVWEMVRQIPTGKVCSYGRIAAMIPPPNNMNPKSYLAFGARWVGGARFDYSQLPDDASAEEYGGSVNLDFWQSEFVFFRLQYSVFDRNFEESDQRILFQAVWAMGPHKHEAY